VPKLRNQQECLKNNPNGELLYQPRFQQLWFAKKAREKRLFANSSLNLKPDPLAQQQLFSVVRGMGIYIESIKTKKEE
jgi:hypothetical protein